MPFECIHSRTAIQYHLNNSSITSPLIQLLKSTWCQNDNSHNKPLLLTQHFNCRYKYLTVNGHDLMNFTKNNYIPWLHNNEFILSWCSGNCLPSCSSEIYNKCIHTKLWIMVINKMWIKCYKHKNTGVVYVMLHIWCRQL